MPARAVVDGYGRDFPVDFRKYITTGMMYLLAIKDMQVLVLIWPQYAASQIQRYLKVLQDLTHMLYSIHVLVASRQSKFEITVSSI